MTASHADRLRASLRGEIIDRPPVALWRHFPVDDQSPESLAAATLHFQAQYDFDLVKVSPASSFCLKDWGVEDAWQGDTEGTRRYTKRVIAAPADWERLPVLDASAPHLAAQLACLRAIRQALGPHVPMIQTVFSPLAQAKNLAGEENLLAHLRQDPRAVRRGLQTIAVTTQRFVEAALATGIDGIFYAVQHAQAHLLSESEYREHGLPHDRTTLEPARDLWCNVLHAHGHAIYFDLLAGLEFPVMNWHDRDTAPGLAQAQGIYKGAVCGGIARDTLVYRSAGDVAEEARAALESTAGKHMILSTGCVVPVIAPHGNILAARRSVE